ncbi:MAG: phage tail protein [Campylobacteraceae bacterium]|jgi:phage-related tail fiber protein|nr:phage tail protein [Campylobacteraceae bacterium]
MNYALTLTNIGKAKIATALANNAQINLLQVVYGDGQGSIYEPNDNMSALKREVYRANIINKKLYPSDNTIIVLDAVIPIDVGGFTIREIGIIDQDNELVAIAAHPEIYKPLPSENSASEMKTNIKMKVSDVNIITLTMPGSVVFATIEYVDDTKTELATEITITKQAIQNDLGDLAAGIGIDMNNKQNKIPVFLTQEEYETAEPDLGMETILLKLF